MTTTKRFLLLFLLLTLAFGACAAPASADADWKAAYLNTLTSTAGAKRAAALCDVTGDFFPELALMIKQPDGATALQVYTATDGGARALPLDKGLSLAGVTKINARWRKGAGSSPVLDVALTAANEYKRAAYKLDGDALKQIFSVTKFKSGGKTRYTLNGGAATSSQYSAGVRAFESANKKMAQLPLAAVAKADSASAVKTKFNTIAKKFPAYGAAKSVALNETKAELAKGETLTLNAKLSPASAFTDQVEWITENERVATVSKDGVVKAVASGSVKVYARTLSGAQKYCTVKVTGPKATEISLNTDALTLIRGSSETLIASFKPQDAAPDVKWSSSKPSVAGVNRDGKVTALSAGRATITATTDNGLKASCTVAVTTRPAVVVDISQHEYSANMDWKKIANSVDLLILRCGVTRTETAPIGVGKDDKFAYYAKMCQEYDIPFGVYFYGKCSDAATAKKEAQKTWDVASPYKPLFYVYDVEESRLTKSLIETYIKELKRLGAKKIGYYVAHHLYGKYKLDTSLVDFIWIPHYGKNDGTVNSTPSYPCDMHQYTSVGRIPGLVGGVDVNRLMGKKDLAWYLKR